MRIAPLTAFGTILAVSVAMAGCAKTQALNVLQASHVAIARPAHVLIQDFSADTGTIKASTSPLAKLEDLVGDDAAEQSRQLGQEVREALSAELVEKIRALGFTPVRVGASQAPAAGDVMIAGRFVNIDEGNAVRRAVVGFGAGQSSVDSEVRILAPGNRTLLSFEVHADSGNTPGAVATAGVGAAAEAGTAATAATSVARGGASAYISASAHQAAEMADRISEQFAGYAARQGWVVSSGH